MAQIHLKGLNALFYTLCLKTEFPSSVTEVLFFSYKYLSSSFASLRSVSSSWHYNPSQAVAHYETSFLSFVNARGCDRIIRPPQGSTGISRRMSVQDSNLLSQCVTGIGILLTVSADRSGRVRLWSHGTERVGVLSNGRSKSAHLIYAYQSHSS
jgi:hypothetical protein